MLPSWNDWVSDTNRFILSISLLTWNYCRSWIVWSLSFVNFLGHLLLMWGWKLMLIFVDEGRAPFQTLCSQPTPSWAPREIHDKSNVGKVCCADRSSLDQKNPSQPSSQQAWQSCISELQKSKSCTGHCCGTRLHGQKTTHFASLQQEKTRCLIEAFGSCLRLRHGDHGRSASLVFFQETQTGKRQEQVGNSMAIRHRMMMMMMMMMRRRRRRTMRMMRTMTMTTMLILASTTSILPPSVELPEDGPSLRSIASVRAKAIFAVKLPLHHAI